MIRLEFEAIRGGIGGARRVVYYRVLVRGYPHKPGGIGSVSQQEDGWRALLYGASTPRDNYELARGLPTRAAANAEIRSHLADYLATGATTWPERWCT